MSLTTPDSPKAPAPSPAATQRAARRRARRRRAAWLGALVLLIVGGGAVYATRPEMVQPIADVASKLMAPARPVAAPSGPVSGTAERPPRPVVAATVRYEDVQPARTLVGTVRARVETDMGFRVTGKVERRLVQVGERVTAGQPLAMLDRTDLALQREQAAAELEAARSSLRQAEAEERRVTDLRKRGWSTESIYDRQRALADEAEGRVKRAERALALADNALAYATLKAEVAGIVTQTMIEPGQVLPAGQPAIRIAQDGDREALVAVPEVLIDSVWKAAGAATLWSEPGRRLPAVLRELSPSADPLTRTYAARFTLREVAPTLQIGMTAVVTLTWPEADRVARLPLSALFNEAGVASVFVVDTTSGALTKRPVIVRGYDSRDVLIASGLAEGEQVVTLGVHKLDTAQRVRIVADRL